MADAFYALVSQNEVTKENSKVSSTGNFYFDEDILRSVGISDIEEEYAEEPGNPLIFCTFLSEEDRKSYVGIELNQLLPDFK